METMSCSNFHISTVKKILYGDACLNGSNFNHIPFNQEGLPAPLRQAGGLLKARELFGEELDKLIQELNGYLIA